MAQVAIYFEGQHIFEGVAFEQHSPGDVEFKDTASKGGYLFLTRIRRIVPWHTVRSVEVRD